MEARYSPCFECLNHYGREYSDECDEFCDYARGIKLRDIIIEELTQPLKKTEEENNESGRT